MADEWGPWIEHDGAGICLPDGSVMQIEIGGPGLVPRGSESVSPNYPGFYWRWKRVKTGWFSSVMRRVCDDPAYAPIIRYRIRKPRGMIVLEALLADLPESVDA